MLSHGCKCVIIPYITQTTHLKNSNEVKNTSILKQRPSTKKQRHMKIGEKEI